MAGELKSLKQAGFKSVELLHEDSAGSGLYGAVYKAKCDDLLCAAKVIHPIAVNEAADSTLFLQEMEFLHTIRHPNIVQYLGTSHDPLTDRPVLLMELMDENLTHFLETFEYALPFHTQVNICHDIALALSFLHSNGIIHRNLSSNNVLMIGGIRAKVSDYGMVELWKAQQKTQESLTKIPGCDAYMPPEAMHEGLLCSDKHDCFSFGVLTIQILTRLFPEPGNKAVYVSDPNFPNGIETLVAEAERRKNHIDMISSDHPLLPVTLNCIKDNDIERPTSSNLCHSLTSIKEAPQYNESKTSSTTDQLIEDIGKQVKDMQTLFLSSVEGEGEVICAGAQSSEGHSHETSEADLNYPEQVQKLVQTLQNQLLTEQQTSSKEKQQLRDELKNSLQQLKEKQLVLEENERILSELNEKVKSQEKMLAQAEAKLSLTKISLKWEKEFKAPRPLSRTAESMVVAGNVAYMRLGGMREVHAYSIQTKFWTRLPDTPLTECTMAVIKRKLTVIGGKLNTEFTNKLLCLIENGGRKKWLEIYPPMSIKRSNVITVPCKSSLVVAGGENDTGYLRTVEILNTGAENLVWSTAAEIPDPLVFASATFCDGHIYIVGGWIEKMAHTYSVLSCSLHALLQTCQMQGEVPQKKSSSDSPWQELTSLPIKGATCVSIKGRLLAIGGRDIHKPTTTIHIYNPVSNSWELLTHMAHPRLQCFAAAFEKKLLVFGGWKLSNKQVLCETDIVEVATIL